MADRARVHSVDVLQRFRPALVTFVEECSAALVSAEADAARVVMRIRGEREPYWKKQIRMREDELKSAKGELAMKKIMRDADDARADVDQVKAVNKARRRVEEAQEKHRLCRQWARRLEKEQSDFRGQVSALRRILEMDMPRAIAELDRMSQALEDYTTMASPSGRTKAPPGKAKAPPGITRRAHPEPDPSDTTDGSPP